MATYILQRVIQMIPVMILATIISFSIIFLLPGDPALLILGDQLASDRTIYQAKRARSSGWTARCRSSIWTGSARACGATSGSRRATASRSLRASRSGCRSRWNWRRWRWCSRW